MREVLQQGGGLAVHHAMLPTGEERRLLHGRVEGERGVGGGGAGGRKRYMRRGQTVQFIAVSDTSQ